MTRLGTVWGLLALAACDPGYSIQGRVTFADGGAAPGVSVALRCADSGTRPVGAWTTDERGAFGTPSQLGCLRADCTFAVEQEATVPVSAGCARRGNWQCGGAEKACAAAQPTLVLSGPRVTR